jgi:hypothetical protein
MAKISVGGSATAGLGLIGRKPVVIVVWGVALLVLAVVPAFAMLAALGPELAQMIKTVLASKGGEPDPAAMQRMMQLQSGMMLFNLGSWIWGTFVKAILCAAVFRALLEPSQSRFAYLRLGAQELWLTLLFLVESVLAYILIVITTLLVVFPAIIVGVAGGHGGQGAAGGVLTACVLGFAALAVLIWIGLRLSMAAPMTFADRQFRLFESWTLTRGSAARLLGVGVLTLLIVLVLELVIAGLVLSALFAAGGPPVWAHDSKAIEAFIAQPPVDLLRRLWPWLAVGGAVWMLVGSGRFTVFCAPWAAAYRDLTRPT